MQKKIDLPVTELLAGLAEEASELAQAALKLRRCYDGTNPTPADPDRQYERFLEEIGDTWLYLRQLSINWQVIHDYMDHKLERWEARLKAKEQAAMINVGNEHAGKAEAVNA